MAIDPEPTDADAPYPDAGPQDPDATEPGADSGE
jgi:hypothetical protein